MLFEYLTKGLRNVDWSRGRGKRVRERATRPQFTQSLAVLGTGGQDEEEVDEGNREDGGHATLPTLLGGRELSGRCRTES